MAFVTCPASAQQGMRVISLDVSTAPAIQSVKPLSQAKPGWRTSFGSERETKEIAKATVPGLDADIVLLQGITDLRALRQAFPGRIWKLVVSRQLIPSTRPAGQQSTELGKSVPATAVAIRYQTGVRMAGQEHLLAQAQTPLTDTDLAPEPELPSPSGETQPFNETDRLIAGTAVRLNMGGRFLWVASVAFDDDCADGARPCAQRDDLDRWRQSKLAAGDAVLTGGLRQLASPAGTSACRDQSLKISPARKDAPSTLELAAPHEGLGCTASVTAGSPATPDAVLPP